MAQMTELARNAKGGPDEVLGLGPTFKKGEGPRSIESSISNTSFQSLRGIGSNLAGSTLQRNVHDSDYSGGSSTGGGGTYDRHLASLLREISGRLNAIEMRLGLE